MIPSSSSVISLIGEGGWLRRASHEIDKEFVPFTKSAATFKRGPSVTCRSQSKPSGRAPRSCETASHDLGLSATECSVPTFFLRPYWTLLLFVKAKNHHADLNVWHQGVGGNPQGKIKKADKQKKRKNHNKSWNATPSIRQQSVRGFWLARLCEQTMRAPKAPEESWTSVWNFFSLSSGKVQNLHDVGVNSSVPSKQGTEVDWGSCVMKLFLASSLHSFISFLSPKYPEAHEERVMIILHFVGRQWFCPASSLLAFLAPASCCPHPLILLQRSVKEVFFSPTTRWRMAVGSGNSVCRTHYWLSGALWLFPRLPGASGPTARGFYRPSGLGTDSESWESKGKRSCDVY